jgi:hypothetical protein
MIKLTYQDIVNLNPCSAHHPSKYIPDTWSGTICELLELPNVAPTEKLWVAYRVLDDKVLRLFAVDCARRALTRIPHPNPRSVAACNVAERYAYGQATAEELRLAASAAADAAYTAAYAAAAYAAAAPAYAASDVAAAAASAAAIAASTSAASAAAAYATYAPYAASDAAAADARSKERKIQITRLICIIEEQEKA